MYPAALFWIGSESGLLETHLVQGARAVALNRRQKRIQLPVDSAENADLIFERDAGKRQQLNSQHAEAYVPYEKARCVDLAALVFWPCHILVADLFCCLVYLSFWFACLFDCLIRLKLSIFLRNLLMQTYHCDYRYWRRIDCRSVAACRSVAQHNQALALEEKQKT